MIIGVTYAVKENIYSSISACDREVVHVKIQHSMVVLGRTDVQMIVNWYMDGKIDINNYSKYQD